MTKETKETESSLCIIN